MAPIGFRSRSLEQEREFEPDPAVNKVAELQPRLLKSLKIGVKGIAAPKQKANDTPKAKILKISIILSPLGYLIFNIKSITRKI